MGHNFRRTIKFTLKETQTEKAPLKGKWSWLRRENRMQETRTKYTKTLIRALGHCAATTED